MSLRHYLAPLTVACALAAWPCFAQEQQDVEVDILVDETDAPAETALDDPALEDDSWTVEEEGEIYAQAEVPATYDVWWGNRSISYGNYLKFDRITAMGAPAAPRPDTFDTIFFGKKKAAVLSPIARATLDDAVRFLRTDQEAEVMIVVQATGGTITAGQLAEVQQRVEAVRRYLLENGIASTRISTNTTGEPQVLPPNTAVIPVSGN